MLFETSGGHKIEIKDFLTFGEHRQISNVYLEGMNVGVDEAGQAKIPEMNAGLSMKAQNKALEILVLSVDGKKENVVSEIENLPVKDGQEVMAKIDEIQNPLTAEKKTN